MAARAASEAGMQIGYMRTYPNVCITRVGRVIGLCCIQELIVTVVIYCRGTMVTKKGKI